MPISSEIRIALGPPPNIDPSGSRESTSRRFINASRVIRPVRSFPASWEIVSINVWIEFPRSFFLATRRTASLRSFSIAGESSDATPLSFSNSLNIANVVCACFSLESVSESMKSMKNEGSAPGRSTRTSLSHTSNSSMYSDPLISNTHQGTCDFLLSSATRCFTRVVFPVPVAPRIATCSRNHSVLSPILFRSRPPKTAWPTTNSFSTSSLAGIEKSGTWEAAMTGSCWTGVLTKAANLLTCVFSLFIWRRRSNRKAVLLSIVLCFNRTLSSSPHIECTSPMVPSRDSCSFWGSSAFMTKWAVVSNQPVLPWIFS